MPSRFSNLNFLDRSISNRRGGRVFLIITIFIEIPILNANNEDPDQTPRFSGFDLGLYCLLMSFLRDTRHICVNVKSISIDRKFFPIKKTRLFKYIEISPPKTQFSDKNSDIFHISTQNIYCGYSLEPPCRGGSNEYPQSMFLSRNKKNNVYPCIPPFYYIRKSGV